MNLFVKWFSTNEVISRAGSTATVPVFDSRTAGEKSVLYQPVGPVTGQLDQEFP